MRWIFGAALLPLLACGAMCLGGMALAFFGLRRGETKPSNHDREEVGVTNESASRRGRDELL